jgi:hypothetical protein
MSKKDDIIGILGRIVQTDSLRGCKIALYYVYRNSKEGGVL